MTESFQNFIAPARGYPQLWRVVLGCILSLIVYFAWVAALALLLATVLGPDRVGLWFRDLAAPSRPDTTYFLLVGFLGLALGAIAAARLFHRRPARSLFGPRPVVIGDFLRAFVIVVVAYLSVDFFFASPGDRVVNMDVPAWLSFLPFTLLAIGVQTMAEELLFRGYLQQQLAARFRSAIVWMGLPALVFALAHMNPELGPNAPLMALAAGVFGLVAADLTAVTGSIGAAWGFHFANNLFAVAVLSVDGTITGLARFKTVFSVDDTEVLTPLILWDIGLLIAVWLLCRYLLRR